MSTIFNYNQTVSESKEESMSKAIELMLLEIENKQKMCKSSSVRPKLNFKNFVLPFLLILVCIFSFITLLYKCEEISAFLQISNLFYNILVVSFFILLIVFTAKPVLLWLILLYQKFAPLKIRKQCCFEPCCSEYMKISIKKYGLIKGINNGINRLSRCHFPNGGIDEPWKHFIIDINLGSIDIFYN